MHKAQVAKERRKNKKGMRGDDAAVHATTNTIPEPAMADEAEEAVHAIKYYY